MLVHINIAKVLAACLMASVAILPSYTNGSSIPIWEFLTRNEKMSYLYSTFAQLVSTHCKATAVAAAIPVNQCKHDLLNYGYEKLQTFTDNQLDAIDPYQRGANEMIWSAIMREHSDSVLVSTRKPYVPRDATEIPTSNNGYTATDADTLTNGFIKNPLFESDSENKHQYAMDMDVAYGYVSRPHDSQLDAVSSQTVQAPHGPYLTGPLVVRVKPDGSPVEEDQHKPFPKDDDLEAFGSASPSPSYPSTFFLSNDRANDAIIPQRNIKLRKVATISLLKDTHLTPSGLQGEKLLTSIKRVREPRHQLLQYGSN